MFIDGCCFFDEYHTVGVLLSRLGY